MKPADGRCEEHGLYLYRTDYGWLCKLGCYYTDDPQKIKDGFIAQYKEELKDKINKIFDNHNCYFSDKFDEFEFNNIKRKILELLK